MMIQQPPILVAPDDPADRTQWCRELDIWRREARQTIGYDDAIHHRPEFAWASSCFCCAKALLSDLAFYDPLADRYLVESFLEDGRQRFGGFDALILWHAYPNIGIDQRNQFDFYRDAPGGLTGLRDVVDRCHRQGVRVILDYNPWDTGTRREPQSDIDVLAQMVRELDADGLFLDTMTGGDPMLRQRLDAARPGVVLEPEGMTPLEHLASQHMSWGQVFQKCPIHGVFRNRWLDRRHMIHVIERWHHDRTEELQMAWMNGAGVMVWENVFGSWVGWNRRDCSILRGMLPIQRRFASLWTDGQWTPLIPTLTSDIFASQWQAEHRTVWTLVNRSSQTIDGPMLTVGHRDGVHYVDLIAGRELDVRVENGQATISASIAGRGIGAILAVTGVEDDLRSFLADQRRVHERAEQDASFPNHTMHHRPAPGISAVPPRRREALPPDMVVVPPADKTMTLTYRLRECGLLDTSSPMQGRPWPDALHQPQSLTLPTTLPAFAVDRGDVTNRQFQRFLQASDYQPRHPQHFLKHWVNQAPAPGTEDQAVVYVDLDDARAYAAWAGKRLPTMEQWQHAMESVVTLPAAGRVWNWTESERDDGRIRFCLLKGGCDWEARGSAWYVDGGWRDPTFTAKFLLTWAGLDRCATIGFRCVIALSDNL